MNDNDLHKVVEKQMNEYLEKTKETKEQYIKNLHDRVAMLKTWDLTTGDRLTKIQRIHILHSYSAAIMNSWQKYLKDINRVSSLTVEETDIMLKFFHELTLCILEFETAFASNRMDEDIGILTTEVEQSKKRKFNKEDKRYVA